MATVCGVEEAGRGPVIGPMVMCGILIDEKDVKRLREIGVKDSKLLTPAMRELLYDQILKIAKSHRIVTVPPEKIDQAVESEGTNLNWLEADISADIINEMKPDKAILDCPSNNPAAYKEYVEKKLEKPDMDIIAEHRADLNYPVVAAASIIAKVVRDKEIGKLKDEHKVDFGSGYPSDKLTMEFLGKYYNKYDFFRKSWQPYKEALKKKSQKKLGEF